MQDIEFFGGIDRKEGKPDARVTSQLPAWYHEGQIDDLRENIARKEREIARGAIPFENIMRAKEEVKREKAKLELIEESRPKLNDVTKDAIYNSYKELGDQIKDYMYTRSEMKLGTVSAHEEADRMVKPSIPVSPEIARMCNLKVVDGKVSRNDASIAWKMMGKLLGDVPTNVETLRRDNVTMRTGGRPKKGG